MPIPAAGGYGIALSRSPARRRSGIAGALDERISGTADAELAIVIAARLEGVANVVKLVVVE